MTIKLVLCTTPDIDVAKKIAHALVQDKLAACVNIIPSIPPFMNGKVRLKRIANASYLSKRILRRYCKHTKR